MTTNEIIYELKEKLRIQELVVKDRKELDQAEFHCSTAKNEGIALGIIQCIDWIKEMS